MLAIGREVTATLTIFGSLSALIFESEVPTTYDHDYVVHELTDRVTKSKRNILRLKEFARQRSIQSSSSSLHSGQKIYWTTPSFGKLDYSSRPSFTAHHPEPKPIVSSLPVPNLDVPKGNIEDIAKLHEEVIKNRPRVICVPSQITADDGDKEERMIHAKNIYYSERTPELFVGDSVYNPDLDLTVPKGSFKNPEFSKRGRLFPKIKPSMKPCLKRLDADKERWLEFTNPYALVKEARDKREKIPAEDKSLDEAWVDDLEEHHTYNIAQRKYRNYTLGYTGFIPSQSLPVTSKRYMTTDPNLSYYEAVDSRKDPLTLRSNPELKAKYERVSLDKLRIADGISYIPVDAYHRQSISNLPYREFRD